MVSENHQDAINQIIQGKRNLLVKDFNAAVQNFEIACQLLDTEFGKAADECGDAYLNYGIALLELARQEVGVLDEGMVSMKNESQVSDDDDEDEEEEGEEGNDDEEEGEKGEGEENSNEKQEEEEGEEQEETSPKSESIEEDIEESINEKNVVNTNGKDSNGIGNDDCKNEPSASTLSSTCMVTPGGSSKPIDDSQPCTSTGITEKDKEEEEEANNIEIAFEVLTLAKTVFDRQLQEGKDVKYRLAEALQKMGEIAIEWENYDMAIDYLTQSLTIRKEILSSDDRLIAETYYHIGNAHAFSGQPDKANDCFQLAVEVIECRVKNKRLQYDNAEKSGDGDLAKSLDVEIKDLESLLPEMKTRIEEKQDQMLTVKEAMETVEKEEQVEEKVVEEKKKQLQEKPVNNISHLVKRKVTDETIDSPKKRLCSTADDKNKIENNNGQVTSS